MEPNAPVPNHSEVPVESYDRSAHGTGPATLTPPPAQERGKAPRRHRPRWFVWLIGTLLGIVLLVLLICALIGGLVMGIALKLANEVTASTTSTQTFAITGTPSLNIHNASGRVQVQAGAADTVSIQITRTARDTSQRAAQADLERIEVNATQAGNQITIMTNFADEGFFTTSSAVNLLITVPPYANITADVTAGDVQIGSLNGVLEITTGAGNVTLRDVVLADGSRVHVSAGSAMVLGTIRPDTTVDITVNTGDVTLQLPEDTATRLDARTNAGNIHINGWPLRSTRLNQAGAVASGPLGEHPSGTIRVRVDAGDITVSQQ